MRLAVTMQSFHSSLLVLGLLLRIVWFLLIFGWVIRLCSIVLPSWVDEFWLTCDETRQWIIIVIHSSIPSSFFETMGPPSTSTRPLILLSCAAIGVLSWKQRWVFGFSGYSVHQATKIKVRNDGRCGIFTAHQNCGLERLSVSLPPKFNLFFPIESFHRELFCFSQSISRFQKLPFERLWRNISWCENYPKLLPEVSIKPVSWSRLSIAIILLT